MTRRFHAMICALIPATIATAHEGDHAHVHGSVATPASVVTIVVQGDQRVIEANGLPDHKPGQFPNRGNPHAIDEQSYSFRMPLQPTANDRIQAVGRHLFGVAVNGVVFDPGTAEVWVPGQPIATRPREATRGGPGRQGAWNYEGMGGMELGIDEHHAHVQPSGAYHYHGLPTGLIARLRKEAGPDRMVLVGYAADGFPIYDQQGHDKADDATSPLRKLRSSYQLKKGDRPRGDAGPGGKYDGTFVQDYEYIEGSGDLDLCNGRVGVTPEYPKGTYYYVLTDTFPFVPRMFRGTPDSSFAKRREGPPPRREE